MKNKSCLPFFPEPQKNYWVTMSISLMRLFEIINRIYTFASPSHGTLWTTIWRKNLGYSRHNVVCIYIHFSARCGEGLNVSTLNPASRRRRQEEKCRIWDSKIWSQMPRDSNPKITALARASSSCKRQTRPLVRESAPHQQIGNSLAAIKIWS
jgi:hypothetical protein